MINIKNAFRAIIEEVLGRNERALLTAVERGDTAIMADLITKNLSNTTLFKALWLAASLPNGAAAIGMIMRATGRAPIKHLERSISRFSAHRGMSPQSPLGVSLALGLWENAALLTDYKDPPDSESLIQLAASNLSSQAKRFEGSGSIFYKLVNMGCEINATDSSGLSALHKLAGGAQSYEAVSALISSGAQINACDNNGRTPAMEAAVFACPETLLLLATSGAFLDAQDKQGNTALHLLCLGLRGVAWPARWQPERFRRCLRILMEGGISADALNTSGLSALDILEHRAPRDIVDSNHFISLFRSFTDKAALNQLLLANTESVKKTSRL